MNAPPLVQIAVSKIRKYAASESGDTVEVVERPHGGISVVMADGQRSGRSAKLISNLVVRKAISLLAEGVRDGATARAAHDYLRTYRRGQVSAELQMVSVDLDSRTMVVTRNCQCPVWVRAPGESRLLDEESLPIGVYRKTRPDISELLLECGMTLVLASDGVWQAGRHADMRMNLPEAAEQLDAGSGTTAAKLASELLQTALDCELGRARDDLTVVAVKLVANPADVQVRQMTVEFPLAPG